MSRCTNPFGVRLSVDVPNKVVINDQLEKLLIVTQILIVSTLRNVHRTVQRNNPLTPKSDWQLIPPGHITLESNINVTRIKNSIIQ